MGSLRTILSNRGRRPRAGFSMGPEGIFITWDETSLDGMKYSCEIAWLRNKYPRPAIEFTLRSFGSTRNMYVSEYKYEEPYDRMGPARDLMSLWYQRLRDGMDWGSVISFPDTWIKETHWGSAGWSREFILSKLLGK
jgi:hypothetical protein